MSSEGSQGWEDRYGREPRKGADILVQALEREGVATVFAYPGGCSMEIHQALTRSPKIRNILCRHEQVSSVPALASSGGASLLIMSHPGASMTMTQYRDSVPPYGRYSSSRVAGPESMLRVG